MNRIYYFSFSNLSLIKKKKLLILKFWKLKKNFKLQIY